MNKNVFYILMGIFILVMIWYVSKTPKATPAEQGQQPQGTGGAKPNVLNLPVVPTPTPTQQNNYITPTSNTPPQSGINEDLQLNVGVQNTPTVKALQKFLNDSGVKDLNGNVLGVDGVYGQKTKSAHDKAMQIKGTTDRSLKALLYYNIAGLSIPQNDTTALVGNAAYAWFNPLGYLWNQIS